MPSTCKFEFDGGKSVYYSGEFVTGRFLLTTTTEKTCNGVFIEFRGRAKVKWSTGSGKYRKTYRDEVTYAYSRTEAFPQGKLPPGLHTFAFQVQIPNEGPSSCVGSAGHITYELTLVIHRPLRFDNKFPCPLKVLRPFDLNMLREYSIPLQAEDTKNLCCWPCSSGPIISKLELPFGGYVPGQAIKYKLYVDNRSKGYDLDGIKLKFKQLMVFTARTPYEGKSNNIETLVETSRSETILRLTKRVLEGELVIPAVPPTLNAGIISISYFVQMNIKTGGCHKDSVIQIPLTIGTVPILGSVSLSQTAGIIAPTAPPSVGISSVISGATSLEKPPSNYGWQ